MLICCNRIEEDEWIDGSGVSFEDWRATIRDQEIVNRWLGGAYATLAHALPVLRACESRPVRILDLACGGADLSRALVDEARRLNKLVEVVALDSNENAIAIAREESVDYPEISFVQGSLFFSPISEDSFDVVIMSTVLHHFSPETVIKALQSAGNMSRGWVVAADLVRSSLAHWGILLFARLLSFNRVSAHDGAVSVCRAYTPNELADLACQANLSDWSIHRHKFYRMALVYRGFVS